MSSSHRNVSLGFFAAERRKNVAPGVSPGFVRSRTQPRKGRKSRRGIFRPFGADRLLIPIPRACARGYVLMPLRGCNSIVRRLPLLEGLEGGAQGLLEDFSPKTASIDPLRAYFACGTIVAVGPFIASRMAAAVSAEVRMWSPVPLGAL